MKYKVGDIVKIKKYDKTMREHGHNSEGKMDMWYGKKVRINYISNLSFEAEGWNWKYYDIEEYPEGLFDPLPDNLFII